MKTVYVYRPDEETQEIWLDDNYISSQNHDNDGWHGMGEAVKNMKRLCDLVGWSLVVKDGVEAPDV